MTSLQRAWERLAPRRVRGIAAVLLPYTGDAIDWKGFEAHVARTRKAGLGVAVNMDTGFGDLLEPAARESVLDATRAASSDADVYAGAYPEAAGDEPRHWHAGIDAIVARGATPVIVQSPAMRRLGPTEKADFYAAIAEPAPGGALAFELSPRFAPHGEIWSDETFECILGVDAIRGSKHSSLDREIELRRLSARDRLRPEYGLFTGNDLAIDLVAAGSDYLLGLATFAPAAFAARDRALAEGDVSFLARNDDLQHLGNVAFREPIPAYKHAAAQFLHLVGHLDGDGIHPRAPRRPDSERILLFDCARRLGLLEDPERAWRERVEAYL
jgi:dihydrodipicolinate synthase/N-acetylneuraminate lyase